MSWLQRLMVPQDEPPRDYDAWRLERWRWTHVTGAIPGTMLLVVAPLVELLIHLFATPLPLLKLTLIRLAGLPFFVLLVGISLRRPKSNHVLIVWIDHLIYCTQQALIAGIVDRATGQNVYLLAGFLIGAISGFYPADTGRAVAFPLGLGAAMAAAYLSVYESAFGAPHPAIFMVMIMVVGVTAFGMFGSLSLDRALRAAFETQQQLTSALVQAEAGTRAKSAFLANMSHEIRTPLNGVLGMTSLVMGTPLTEQQRRYMDAVRSSGEALLAILNDVLDFSKIEAGRLSLAEVDFDVEEPIAGVADLHATAAHARGLELVTRIAPSVPRRLRGDAGRLRQVVGNLVSNAIKFTPEGRITIDVEPLSLSDGEVTLHVAVQDTGAGVAPELVGRIFEPFTQGDASLARVESGTGLGLAISRQIVSAMGGELGVDSVLGEGSRFWFTVRLRPALADVAAPAPDAVLARRSAMVVVADEVVACVLRDLLEREGVSAELCDARRALVAVQARRGDPPDWLILDGALATTGTGSSPLLDLLSTDALFASVRLVLSCPFGSAPSADVLDRAHATLPRPVRSSALRAALRTALAPSTHRGPSPARSDASAPDPAPARIEVDAAARPRILVVEDNAINRMLAVEYLELLGCDADVAEDGREALDAVARVPYHAILMDCHMPEMDGFEATAAIRRLGGDIAQTPIIALTADALAGDRERTSLAGMDDHLTKPLRLGTLRDVLARWLSAKPRAASGTSKGHVSVDFASRLVHTRGPAGGDVV